MGYVVYAVNTITHDLEYLSEMYDTLSAAEFVMNLVRRDSEEDIIVEADFGDELSISVLKNTVHWAIKKI